MSARLGHHRTDDTAYEGVRRTARDAVVPGEQIPGHGAGQRAEDDVCVHNARLHDALAHRSRDAEVKNKDRDEIEHRSKNNSLSGLEHTCRHNGGN